MSWVIGDVHPVYGEVQGEPCLRCIEFCDSQSQPQRWRLPPQPESTDEFENAAVRNGLSYRRTGVLGRRIGEGWGES